MPGFWDEFLTITVLQLLAVASPGPDFAIVVREAITKGKRSALWTTLGITLGISIHCAYCIMGIGILISQSVMLFQTMKILGGCYLVYVGVKALLAKKSADPFKELDLSAAQGEWRKAFRLGFLTNVLNPKATLFILSLFSVVINPATPQGIQVLYGVWIAVLTALWFAFLSCAIGNQSVRRFVAGITHWIERATGIALLGAGGALVLSD